MLKGLDSMRDALKKGGMDLLKLKDGSSVVLRILAKASDIIAVYEHTEQFSGDWKTITCLDKNFNKKGDCPLCSAGKNPAFRAYIPVLDKSDRDNPKVKVFKASKEVIKQLLGLVEEYGELDTRDYKITRNGEKLQTTYQFFPKNESKEDLSGYEIPDIEDRVSPLTREAIIAMMGGGNSTVTVAGDVTNGSDEDYPF